MAHITTPTEFLGFQPGEDRKLAGWPTIVSYLKLLEQASDRVRVDEIGRSTEDNPFLVCTISSPDNLANAERLRLIQQSLSDPRTVDDRGALNLVGDARAVVAITCSIHATEVGATQMSVELAHLLASSQHPRVLDILDSVILLLIPSMNPDGLIRVKDWYDASLGTHFEGSMPPYLYHKYTGHDNNRDWFMFTQQETRLVVEHVHNAWRPHVTLDMHQTRSDGMRMILPPLVDPIGPNVDPVLQSGLSVLGTYMAAQLTAEGKAGVAVNVVYDSYSPNRSYPHYHGGVRVLSEAASVKIATPVDVPKSKLRDDRGELPRVRSWNHPMPWEGGRWTLRDIVEYDLSLSMACLEHAARNREWWIRNSHDVLRRATSSSENPRAYVIPREQHDRSAADELLGLLDFADVEIHEAAQSANSGDVHVRQGDAVVLTKQPFGSFAQTMLERRHYPDMRQYPGGPPKHPYDSTAHCLPLNMGVTCHEITQPLKINLVDHPFEDDKQRPESVIPANAGIQTGGSVGNSQNHLELALVRSRKHGRSPRHPCQFPEDAPALAISPKSNAAARVVNRLISQGSPVFRALDAVQTENGDLPAGTWVIPSSAESLSLMSEENGAVQVQPLWERPDKGLQMLRAPRIGLYASYVPCIEEGWTRFLFDEYGFKYVSLADRDIREGGLSSRFDCIIIPHQEIRQIHRGLNRTHHSPHFSGGLGDVGVDRLRDFAERGGTIIGWDNSASFLVRYLELPAVNPLAKLSHSQFFAPGSLLNIEVDTNHPLGWGMPETAAALFMKGPAHKLDKGTVVATYSERDTLLNGWLIGADKIAGLAALSTIPLGLGQVVLFGFRPHFRAQARGTYKLMFNALYQSGAA